MAGVRALENFAIQTNMEWRRHPIRIVKGRRVCETEDCTTILSRYNPRRNCSVHERKPCPQP